MEVRLLGPFEVRPAGGHGAELATLVALAAMLPAGIPVALMNELLPQPGAVAAAAGQLGAWLGVDPSGAPRLADRGGAWSLSADVRVDWHTFRELTSTTGTAGEELRLASALALIRGELCAGIAFPPVAQEVLQPVLAELRTVVVNAIQRDVELARSADDPARAEWALRQGLTLLPREDRLRQIQLA